MITFRASQKKIKIDRAKIIRDTQKILEILDYADFDVGIWITTNATIQKYNREYRKKDAPTDILSFPAYPDLKAGERLEVCCPDEQELGDLIISAEYVAREAEKLGVSFDERLRLLLVHGILHLLGYDHIKDVDFRRMRAKEVSILKKL